LASKNKQDVWLWIVVVVILAGIGWVVWSDNSAPVEQTAAVTPPPNLPLQPVDNTSTQTMSPEYFQDPKARAAYQVAKDIPEVLQELPCFCGCMVAHGHKNNLFCFRDEHGSACEICEDIALDAKTMHGNGASVKEIQETIRNKYSQYSPVQ
jgi:hypothetical protein